MDFEGWVTSHDSCNSLWSSFFLNSIASTIGLRTIGEGRKNVQGTIALRKIVPKVVESAGSELIR